MQGCRLARSVSVSVRGRTSTSTVAAAVRSGSGCVLYYSRTLYQPYSSVLFDGWSLATTACMLLTARGEAHPDFIGSELGRRQ